jgi:hypothetical protein
MPRCPPTARGPRTRRDRGSIGRERLLAERAARELAGRGAARGGIAYAQRGIFDQRAQRGGDVRSGARRREDPCAAVPDEQPCACILGAGDDGAAEHHRFLIDEAETLVARRGDDDMRRLEQIVQAGLVDAVEQAEPFARVRGECSDVFFLRADQGQPKRRQASGGVFDRKDRRRLQ